MIAYQLVRVFRELGLLDLAINEKQALCLKLSLARDASSTFPVSMEQRSSQGVSHDTASDIAP